MLQKAIDAIMQKEVYKYNEKYATDMKADAEKIYNAGWDALPDDTVLQYKGNQVALKNGDNLEVWLMKDFAVNMGKMDGDKERLIKSINLDEHKKQAYLAQSIIAKYYTVSRM